MRQIIAAIDFSPVSDEVINHAVKIAQAFSAPLVLLHVASTDMGFVGLEAGPKSVRNGIAHELRHEHRELQQKAKDLRDQGIDATALLVEGPTVDMILKKVEHLNADLLVLGSHGHGEIHHILVGSISEGVLHKAVIPILIVPARLSVPKKARNM